MGSDEEAVGGRPARLAPGGPEPGRGPALSPSTVRRSFPDAFAARPVLYWCDTLASAALGWGAFAVALHSRAGSLRWYLASVMATFALYRAVLFIHELAHLRSGVVPGLETVWNLLVGFPLMVPSLMYVGSHLDHHRRSLFGTRKDPEYDSLAHWSPLRIVASTLTMVAVPGILALRWGVLGPLSSAVPFLRPLVVARASTLVINGAYRRPAPAGRDAVRWALEETAAAALFWAVCGGLLTGRIPAAWLLQWYGVGSAILLLNHLRTLAAHRYENEGHPVDGLGQLLDSVNLREKPGLTPLLAPVGLRYHALHHLAPTLPYHSLGSVHRRLRAELPADSPYRATETRGVLAGVGQLLAVARRNRRARTFARKGLA